MQIKSAFAFHFRTSPVRYKDYCADLIHSDLTLQRLNHAQEKAKILSIYSISIFRAVYTAIM